MLYGHWWKQCTIQVAEWEYKGDIPPDNDLPPPADNGDWYGPNLDNTEYLVRQSLVQYHDRIRAALNTRLASPPSSLSSNQTDGERGPTEEKHQVHASSKQTKQEGGSLIGPQGKRRLRGPLLTPKGTKLVRIGQYWVLLKLKRKAKIEGEGNCGGTTEGHKRQKNYEEMKAKGIECKKDQNGNSTTLSQPNAKVLIRVGQVVVLEESWLYNNCHQGHAEQKENSRIAVKQVTVGEWPVIQYWSKESWVAPEYHQKENEPQSAKILEIEKAKPVELKLEENGPTIQASIEKIEQPKLTAHLPQPSISKNKYIPPRGLPQNTSTQHTNPTKHPVIFKIEKLHSALTQKQNQMDLEDEQFIANFAALTAEDAYSLPQNAVPTCH